MNGIEKWSIYEASVQSYRSNFISSQSLLLAVAAIFYEKESPLVVCLVAIIALFQMWYIWFRVIRVRALYLDFNKHDMGRLINSKGGVFLDGDSPLTEKAYLHDIVDGKKVRRAANITLAKIEGNNDLKYNFRRTRIKLDILLPISFTIIWLFITLPLFYDLVSKHINILF